MVIENDNGLLIGSSKRPRLRMRLIAGALRQIDLHGNPIEPIELPISDEVPELDAPATDSNLSDVAKPLLDIAPSAIVAIYSDSKGNVLGSTITRPRAGHTPAAFRAAFRSLPTEAQRVTFATGSRIDPSTRVTINEYADIFLIGVDDCLLVEPKIADFLT